MTIANEFKRGIDSDLTVSRKKWKKPTHYLSFVSYVICRILSQELHGYNPTKEDESTPRYFIQNDAPLLENVSQFCRFKFGASQKDIDKIMDYPATKFKRKTWNAEWFYVEVHKRLEITAWKCSPRKDGDPRPPDFQWYPKKPTKKVKREKVKIEKV